MTDDRREAIGKYTRRMRAGTRREDRLEALRALAVAAAVLLILLLATRALPAQERTVLAGPSSDIQLAAESGIVAYVDDRWVRVDSDAVRQTQATLRVTLEGRKAEDFGLQVSQWKVVGTSVVPSYGESVSVAGEDGELQWRLSLPSGGTWQVLLIDYGTRRHYQLSVTVGDQPDPDPDPDPDPPPPGDEPFDSPGFAVLVLHEASDRSSMPASQVAIFTSNDVANYLSKKAVKLPAKGPRGESTELPFWAFYDDDYTQNQLKNLPEPMREAYLDVKDTAAGEPWLAISKGTGKGGWQGPLPESVPAMLDLLKKYGGP